MLTLPAETRGALWARLIEAIERYTNEVGTAPVAPPLDVDAIRETLAPFDFARGMAPLEALDFAVENLWRHQVHTSNRRYFGLFNPATTTMGIAADALVAAFNPQLAAWSPQPLRHRSRAAPGARLRRALRLRPRPHRGQLHLAAAPRPTTRPCSPP